MAKTQTTVSVPDEIIMNKIYFIRGHKVILDRDLGDCMKLKPKGLMSRSKEI
jgi:hypothetical protein